MSKKPTIEIFIPAHNESKTLPLLLDTLSKQKYANFKLNSITIYSDGSTDKTPMVVKQFKNVRLINFKKNLGKAFRINQALSNNKSDLIIQLDADIVIKDDFLLSKIVKNYLENKSADLICIVHEAIKPTSFIGSIAYFGYEIWDKSRQDLKTKADRYFCEGGMLVYSKKFAKAFRVPTNSHNGDDSYSFYYAVSKGFNVYISKNTKVFIELPSKLEDYINQMKRFLTDPDMVSTNFDPSIVEKYETMTSAIKLQNLFKLFVRQPLIGGAYIAVQGFVKLQMISHTQKLNWQHIQR